MHVYHEQCMRTWVRSKTNLVSCPLCNRQLLATVPVAPDAPPQPPPEMTVPIASSPPIATEGSVGPVSNRTARLRAPASQAPPLDAMLTSEFPLVDSQISTELPSDNHQGPELPSSDNQLNAELPLADNALNTELPLADETSAELRLADDQVDAELLLAVEEEDNADTDMPVTLSRIIPGPVCPIPGLERGVEYIAVLSARSRQPRHLMHKSRRSSEGSERRSARRSSSASEDL